MSENKINTKAFIPYLASFIFYLAAYLIYTLIPSSELANGLDHPGITAVYVLTASPVFAVAALTMLILAFIMNKTYFVKLLSQPITVTAFSAMALMIALSIYFTVAFVALQYKMGFTAPIYGTKWSGYSVYMLITVIIQFISLVMLTLIMKGILKKTK